VATTDRVREGNLQLAEAGQRSADTRKWVLLFLIMASLVLLFLDWYD
jgi:syntaxin 18